MIDDRSQSPQAGARARQGYALPAVIVTSLVAAVLTSAFLFRVTSSARTTADLLQRRQTFYAADGMSRIVIREVENYMMENDDPTTEDLQDPANIPSPEVPGFSVSAYELVSSGAAFDAPITGGPFEGMHAHQKPIQMHMTTRRDGTDVGSQVDMQVTLGQISMFQFFVFADDYIEIYPGPSMTINPGRVHANGDLCMGSDNTFQVEHVTSAQRVLASDSRCRRKAGAGFWLWTGSAYKKMTESISHACVNCGGTGQGWRAFAVSNWRGHVKDRAHGVTRLRVPISGTPRTQSGLDASGAEVSNERSARFLVDPVLATDTADIREQKLAWKADLRIINGVWYVNDGSWPGTPVWSDHPGSFVTTDAEGVEGATPQAVGQADLALSQGWSKLPRRYSPYGWDSLSGRIQPNDDAILTYGTLYRRSDGAWRPGYWITGAKGKTYTGADLLPRAYVCNRCNGAACYVSTGVRQASDPLCDYQESGVSQPLVDSQFLQGTRAGFIDYRIKNADGDKGRVLPLNFDVEALAAALEDTAAGELGSYFRERPFNGIVYITNTWTGSMDGLPGGRPQPWPTQGDLDGDAGQAATRANPMDHLALPRMLCSQTLGQVPGLFQIPLSGPPSDGNPLNGFEPNFAIPSCDEGVNDLSTPNAVRVVNAAELDQDVFPGGLTIATNLPLYALGDVNVGSDTTDGDAEPWVPMLLAGDAVSLMSAAWEDDNAPWDETGSWSNRRASSTTYNVELLSGLVQTVDGNRYSGGIENYPRFVENWSGRDAVITGSFVVAFNSVHASQPWKYGSPIYEAPNRKWGFDNHLRLLINQPPGAPLLSVHSVSRLNRM